MTWAAKAPTLPTLPTQKVRNKMSDRPSSVELPSSWHSDDDWWREIKFQFEDLTIHLRHLKFETFVEAIGYPVPGADHKPKLDPKPTKWRDDSIGTTVRPWLQVPFDPNVPVRELDELRQSALALVPEIRDSIERKELSPRFIFAWGNFVRWGSAIEDQWLSARPIPNNLKASATQSIKPHKVWYAKQFLLQEKPGLSRSDIDGNIYGFLCEIIERGSYPDARFQEPWFRKFMPKGDLAASFRDGKLPRYKSDVTDGESIEELAQDRDCVIPPTDPTAYNL